MGDIRGKITILHEEDSFLVVDKPAGLMVHGDGRAHEQTLVDWLLKHAKVSPEVGEPWVDQQGQLLPRPGIVHRLDRDTSGVLIIAKTQKMYEWLKAQFKERTVVKKYEALVHGYIEADRGVVDRPIGRSGADFRKKSAQRGAVGVMREAVTEYRVIQRMPSSVYPVQGATNIEHLKPNASGYTHVALFPKTGRTHQLRVHMKAINHPIVGDVLYGTAEDKVASKDGAPKLMLRAVSLRVPLPSGGMIEFSCKGLEL